MRLLLANILLSLLSFTSAQSQTNSSVFVYQGADPETQFVFALQVDRQAGDLYFHLSAPSGNSWAGVGIGDRMRGSLMFIAYPDASGHGVTLSPRLSNGHFEPVFHPDIHIDVRPDYDRQYKNDKVLEVDAVCRNCFQWATGGLDLTSTAQPFIFAVGPSENPVRSDARSAGLTQHTFVGHFAMDMTAATQQDSGNFLPGPFYTSQHASPAHDVEETDDPSPRIHGIIMSIVFIFLLPSGSLLLRIWNKVMAHAIMQVIATVLFIMGFAGGIVISRKYNRTQSVNTSHQVIGILLLIGIITQLVLGVLHHRSFQKDQRKTIKGWIHLYLGPFIIFMGLINGGLGLKLAKNTYMALPYAITILIVLVIYIGIRVLAWRRRRQNTAFNKEAADLGAGLGGGAGAGLGGGPRAGARPGSWNPQFGVQQTPTPEREPSVRKGRFRGAPLPVAGDFPLERYENRSGPPRVELPVR